jgi:hypothetical protein
MTPPVANTFRVVQIQTKASANIVVRNAKGRKLFDMDIHGVTITITTPLNAEIKIAPKTAGNLREKKDEAIRRAQIMANELKKQKIYDALRGQVSARLMRAMDIAEADIANLSLGEIINVLFLMHGDGGSTGNFGVTFGAALKMVGQPMMWHKPDTNVTGIEPAQRKQ